MIRINLIGDEVKVDSNSLLWLVAYAASVLLVIATGVTSWYFLSSWASSLEEDAVVLERQLNRLKEQTKDVKQLDAKKNELQSMTMAIAVLKKIQEGPVKLLDDLNLAVPERLWFNSVELKDQVLRIEGIALIDAALVDFVHGLEKSPYFERVDIIERLTVPLVQINAFSSFDSSQARKVVRGERDRVLATLGEIRKEVETAGLLFVQGLPDHLKSDSVMPIGAKQNEKESPSINDGLKRLSGRPSVYVWESLEQVKGENYVIEAKVRLTEKPVSLDSVMAALAPTPKPTAMPVQQPTKKKAAEE